MNRQSSSIQIFTIIFCLCGFIMGFSQTSQRASSGVYVDDKGVMRWEHNKEEVNGFGVNYSAPFAHAYRAAQNLGIDLKKAIDMDVAHFSRLGFDLYRIHVWDTEISDTKGNLLENEHLDLLDYLLKQLKDRGINFVITPIAYWGSGWPEPDPPTPGFSYKYGKEASLTNPEAIKAQEKYLAGFLNHVNPYTGIAYKDELNIIAFEISNEPHHRGKPEDVKEFINRMVASMRSTGTEKPIFYNVTHSIHLANAYFTSNIQGGTFQWYPTGLMYHKELRGNLLPNVNHYKIPFDDILRENAAARLVYEFDAADVMKTYIYPVMARSLREAGIQLGTHFAYDPTYLANTNTEYNTHYMNLAYTPRKALALMIAGEVFRKVERYADPGEYPQNLTFGDFHIDYKRDLSELNSPEKFIYTNNTSSLPVSSEDLLLVAGYGDSQVVRYEGTGAYFLDRIQEGVWRLEVMPDAFMVENPFGRNSLEKKVAVINHTSWKMGIYLEDLGSNFEIRSLTKQGGTLSEVKEKEFMVEPGVYILTRSGISDDINLSGQWDGKDLNEFAAPITNVETTHLVHQAIPEISENSALELSAEIISNEGIEKVEVWLQNGNTYDSIELQHQRGYVYTAQVPENLLKIGFLKYRIIVSAGDDNFTFPSRVKGKPSDWDFPDAAQYKTRIVTAEKPIYLFNTSEDTKSIVGKWLPGLNTVPTTVPEEAEYQVNVEQLFTPDIENPQAEPVHDYSFRYYFRDKIEGRKKEMANGAKLILKGRSLTGKKTPFQLAVVMENGSSFGKIIILEPEVEEYEVFLSELEPVQTVILPRSYPTFLPYYFEHKLNYTFDFEDAESLQFSIGPGMDEAELDEEQGVGIIHVRME